MIDSITIGEKSFSLAGDDEVEVLFDKWEADHSRRELVVEIMRLDPDLSEDGETQINQNLERLHAEGFLAEKYTCRIHGDMLCHDYTVEFFNEDGDRIFDLVSGL